MSKKMISVKKIFAAVIAIAMVIAVMPAAFASTVAINECQIIEDTIVVSYTIGQYDAREHVIAIVTSGSNKATYENAVAFAYGQATEASSSIEVLMPDELPTGTYTVTLGIPSANNAASAKVSYMGSEDRAAIMDSIVGSSASAESLVRAFDGNPLTLDVAGSKNDYYKDLSQSAKLQFAQYIIDHREDAADENGELGMADIGALADEALLVTYVDNDTISKKVANLGYKEMFKEFADVKGIIDLDTEDGRYKMISNATDFFRAVREQDGYEPSVEGIQNCLDDALTIERINEAGWLEIGEVLYDLADMLPDDLKEEMTDDKLEEVTANSTIKNYFGKSMKADTDEYKRVSSDEKLPAYSFEQLKNTWIRAYKDAVDKYDEYLDNKNSDKDSGGSSGSSGSGSSGSSGNKSSGSVTVDRSSVRPDPLGQKKIITDYYDDMAGYEWAAPAVLSLTEKGIVSGNGNMKFDPARVLKREEFMKMLVNTFNLVDMTASCSFSDCDKNAWYYVYVASAEKAGITNGRGDGTFGVGDYVTREEMATMIYRAARSNGVNLYRSGNGVAYSDMNSLSAYAVEAVTALTDSGVISGSDGKFEPQAGATRAQAAVAIYNISNLYNK